MNSCNTNVANSPYSDPRPHGLTQRSASVVSSIVPGDSVSQVNAAESSTTKLDDEEFEPNSSVCPTGLNRGLVYWSKEDAKNDPALGATPANPARINMRKAVVHQNGTQIQRAEYRAMQSTGKDIIRNQLLPLPDIRAWKGKKTKSYYKKYYPVEWAAAIEEFEKRERLLKYCCDHWKADELLKKLVNGDAEEIDDEQENPAPDRTTAKEKIKRAASESTNKKAKKRSKAASHLRGLDGERDEMVPGANRVCCCLHEIRSTLFTLLFRFWIFTASPITDVDSYWEQHQSAGRSSSTCSFDTQQAIDVG